MSCAARLITEPPALWMATMARSKPTSPLLRLTLAAAIRKSGEKYGDRHLLDLADWLERRAYAGEQLNLPLQEPDRDAET